ncbi:MAG: hypothetical protein AABW41_03875 [Nanoarchaeota archaeon]
MPDQTNDIGAVLEKLLTQEGKEYVCLFLVKNNINGKKEYREIALRCYLRKKNYHDALELAKRLKDPELQILVCEEAEWYGEASRIAHENRLYSLVEKFSRKAIEQTHVNGEISLEETIRESKDARFLENARSYFLENGRYGELAQLYEKIGKLKEAISYYEMSLFSGDVIDYDGKTQEMNSLFFNNLLRACEKLGLFNEALNYCLRVKEKNSLPEESLASIDGLADNYREVNDLIGLQENQ